MKGAAPTIALALTIAATSSTFVAGSPVMRKRRSKRSTSHASEVR